MTDRHSGRQRGIFVDVRSTASLVGSNRFNREGITSFIRQNLQSNPSAIEALAVEIARTSSSRDERNNRLSSFRMLLRNTCDELGLPKHTVMLRGTTYCLEISAATSRSRPDPLEPSIYRPLRQAAQRATPKEKEQMLTVVLEILGLPQRP